MTGPWNPNKPDHRDPRQDEASRLWAAGHRDQPPGDPLENAQLTMALILGLAFIAGFCVGTITAALILGAY